MILHIDQNASVPIYLQIRGQIVGAIAEGDLKPGDALPSVRRLAADLGVNLHTVNKSYAVLRDEGYVIVRGRSGAFIADFAEAGSDKTDAGERRMAESLHGLVLEHKARGGSAEAFMQCAADAVRAVFEEGDR